MIKSTYTNTEEVFAEIQAEFTRGESIPHFHDDAVAEVMSDMCAWYWPSCASAFVVISG